MNIQFSIAEVNDTEFLAWVCREADYFYDKIVPGAFKKQAVKFESPGYR